jgi:hypothetical protein
MMEKLEIFAWDNPHVGRVYFLLATTDLLLQLCFQFLVGVEKKPKYWTPGFVVFGN